MSYLTAHVLDASAGRPADGVSVRLLSAEGDAIAAAVTNADGRVPDFGPDTLPGGEYQVVFGTGEYFAARGLQSFHPRVVITIVCDPDEAHYHIPLLLSPFSYTTYRGS